MGCRQCHRRSEGRRQACLVAVWLFTVVAVIPVGAVHFPIKTYTVADGLLRDSVYKIKQDSRGFLWFCTPEGISRFDGYSFTNFTTDDGLPDRHVNDLLQTSTGAIYLATDGGLVRLEANGSPRSTEHSLFSVFEPPDATTAKFQVLLETRDGRVFCGTNDGIFIFDGRAFSKAEFSGGVKTVEVNDLKRSTDGRVWAATAANGIFHSEDDLHFTPGAGLPEIDATTITQDRDGKLWVGLRPGGNGGVCRLDPSGQSIERCFTMKDGLPSGWVTSIFSSHDGQIWIGTTKSVCEWQGEGGSSICARSTATSDICDADIWNLLEDKDNNLWMGTRCGLKKVSSDGFSYYNEKDGLGRGLINSIFEDRTGSLYATLILPEGRQIGRLEGDSFRSLVPHLSEKRDYFGWGWKQTILHDSFGAWWVPTGSGVFHSGPGTPFESLAKLVIPRNEFPEDTREVFRLFEDSNSDVWLATTGVSVELWRWKRAENKWEDLTQATGVGSTRTVTAFAEDAQKNIWITTGSDAGNTALIEIRHGDVRVFDSASHDLIRGWLRDEYFDSEGRLWIASTATGLLRIDDPNAQDLSISRYSTASGMSSTGVYCVTNDGSGNVYAGTGRGIDRLDPSTGTVENFTTFDGLPDSTVEVCYRDRNNTLWFGTSHGLVHYVPPPPRSRQPPAILLTGLRVNGEPRTISVLGETEIAETDLSPSERAVSVDFVGLGATLGETLRYEYKLNDADWQPTINRTLNFADLQSGSYSLLIRAVTRDAIMSDTPAHFSFRIRAPIWQRWWFVLSISILGAGIVYVVYRSRLGKLLELERTRTRIATDLHDDIGANLSKIALLSELVKMKLTNGNEDNKRMLATIADVSRSTVDSMRDIVWAINPARDSVLELTRRIREHAEDTLVPLGVTVDFDTKEGDYDHTVPMDVRRELLLIVKEVVSNAAKHSECRNKKIEFSSAGKMIDLRIADDGRGFDVDEAHEGNGLANMRSRARRIGAVFDVVSHPGAGTVITVRTNGLATPPNRVAH